MDENNPYEAPSHAVHTPLPAANKSARAARFTYISWVFVFALNMAVPLLFSSSLTREHGKLGMSLAALLLFASGCYICAVARKLAAALIAGGVLVALSQLFPILQIIAGMIGMSVGETLGLARIGDGHPTQLFNEYGGFVVTFATGAILMAAAASAGMLMRSITPARWWQRSDGVE